MFLQILEKIKEFGTIIIHRHVRPDGDCIGSQMGLKQFLKDNFKDKNIYAVGDAIPDYLTRYGSNDEISEDIYNDALVIVVDTANELRICDERYKLGKYIIKIDHHDDSPDYGNLIYRDPLSPACSSILASMFQEYEKLGYVVSVETAKCLYVGITTDTGRFRFRGVSSTVFNNAGWLIDKGVDIEDIYTRLYIKEKEVLKLQGYVYNNFNVTENGVAYIYFTKKVMNEYNVTKEDAANLVSSLDSINGSLIWVAFVDQMKEADPLCEEVYERPENEIRVRLRSRFVSINHVGAKYRGGGHLQAAGATIYSLDEMNQMLEELDQLLKEYKENNKEAF